MNEIAVIPERPRLAAGARPTAIVPTDMDSAYRLAKAVCEAQMAPKGLDTPAKAMVAIMHGLEIGMTPMAALQRIAVVNGRPTIWGDGAIGLVRGSGLCEFIHERIDGDGERMVAFCEAKRRGETKPVVGSFSVADARVAGLWDKAGPWKQYPKRMLQMRARAFALRDGFADVLGGLHLREEIEDDPREESRHKPPAPPPVAAIEHNATVIEAEAVTAPLPPPPPPPAGPRPQPAAKASETVDIAALLQQFADAAKGAIDPEKLLDVWNEIVQPHYDSMIPSDQASFDQAFRWREAEVGDE